MKRLRIKEKLTGNLLYDLEGSIEFAIEFLRTKKIFYEEKSYENVELAVTYDYGEDDQRLVLFGSRLETDAEMKRRQKKLAAARKKAKRKAEQKETSEKKLYEKLKKK